jgi:hypothetical protein
MNCAPNAREIEKMYAHVFPFCAVRVFLDINISISRNEPDDFSDNGTNVKSGR